MTDALRGLVSLGVVAGLLFGSAGRWDLPFFWAYVVSSSGGRSPRTGS